ncbi:hypothetical protein [Pseudomonas sp. dw_358]|uniref:hypothetical protein n=1 Tax=Pseudomonas sp. dw_358 TaxID=2720083 RepID=UPI001BD5B407|nr:hypothetical protein [Pseudomonas sp. dw_358]
MNYVLGSGCTVGIGMGYFIYFWDLLHKDRYGLLLLVGYGAVGGVFLLLHLATIGWRYTGEPTRGWSAWAIVMNLPLLLFYIMMLSLSSESYSPDEFVGFVVQVFLYLGLGFWVEHQLAFARRVLKR